MSALLWNVSSFVDDPQFGLSDVFTWLDWGYSFGQECHRSDVCPQFLPQFFLYAQRNSIQDDVTSCSWVNPVVPSSCSTLRFMAHSSWLWTWPFSAWFSLGTWGPLGTPRVSVTLPGQPCSPLCSLLDFHLPTLPGVPGRRWLSSAWSPSPAHVM